MPAQKMRLNDTAVKRLGLAKRDKAFIVRDSDLGGFHLRVSHLAKVYKVHVTVRKDGKHTTRGKTLGDAREISADDARRDAEDFIRMRDKGELSFESAKVIAEEQANALTLGEAWEKFRPVLIAEKKSPRTIENYSYLFAKYLPRWHNTPLKDITRTMVVALHGEISARGILSTANSVITLGGNIYNYALKGLRTPGLDPLSPWTGYRLFHKIKARQTGLGSSRLAAWWDGVDKLSPVLREANLFTLLSALRLENLTALRRSQINFADRCASIDSAVKGDKPFRLPLSQPMVDCLFRAIEASRVVHEVNAEEWVFASDKSASGHIENIKNVQQWTDAKGVKKVKVRTQQSAHALRHSWRVLADEARIPATHSKILMNHRIPSDVHSEYLSLDEMFDQLRESQDRVSSLIMNALSAPPPGQSVVPHAA